MYNWHAFSGLGVAAAASVVFPHLAPNCKGLGGALPSIMRAHRQYDPYRTAAANTPAVCAAVQPPQPPYIHAAQFHDSGQRSLNCDVWRSTDGSEGRAINTDLEIDDMAGCSWIKSDRTAAFGYSMTYVIMKRLNADGQRINIQGNRTFIKWVDNFMLSTTFNRIFANMLMWQL
jgi:hypothetical protein